MATFDELKERGGRKVCWFELDGIPWAGSDGYITEVNKVALFSDSVTTGFTFRDGLRTPRRADSRSIELLKGTGRTGGFEVELLDVADATYPDGFLTWLFGSERSTIARTYLTADVPKHAGGAGHNWAVVSTASFPANPVTLYCELETGRTGAAHGAGQFNDVTRSRHHSHAAAHRQIGDTLIFPEVTDHPTIWQDRGGTLFVTFADATGALAGTPATARAVAHKVRGVLRTITESEGVYVLTFAGIDTLLDRQLGRGLPKARVSGDRVHFEIIGVPGAVGGNVMDLVQEDSGGGNEETFHVNIALGDYSISDFIQTINAALDGLTSIDAVAFSGQVQIALEPDALLLTYRTAAAGKPTWAVFLAEEGGFGNANCGEVWERVGISTAYPEGRDRVTARLSLTASDDTPAANADFETRLARSPQIVVDGRRSRVHLGIETGQGDSLIADFANIYDGDFIALRSNAGVQLFGFPDVDQANGVISLSNLGVHGELFAGPVAGLVHEGSLEQPIWIQRVYYSQPGDFAARTGPAGENVLKLLLSTGLASYNDANYDTLPEGIGIEFPNETPDAGGSNSESWIDVANFERFFSETAGLVHTAVDILIDPISAKDWLTKRLAFLGGYLVVENGQLKARRGLAAPQHLGLVVAHDDIIPGNHGMERSFRATVKGVRHRWGYSWQTDSFAASATALVGNLQATLETGLIEYEDKGIIADMGGILRLHQDILAEFGIENPIYHDTFGAIGLDLEAGQIVQYSDEGAIRNYIGQPNINGTRGHVGVRMLVLDARYSHDRNQCKVKMLRMGRQRGGFAPSAWINSFATVAGKSVLTCAANVFGDPADGVDVWWFRVGDLVRVVRVNPTLAGADPGVQTQEAGLVVESVDTVANTITLTATMAVFVPPIAGRALAIIYDEYVAGQMSFAKAFVHVSDGVDINGTGDSPYVWA